MKLPGEVAGPRFLKAMSRLGWDVVRQRGSHRQLRNRHTGQAITVAFHSKLRRNTIHRTLRLAGVEESEFLSKL